MLHSLHAQIASLVTPALAQRLTLLFNHVLASEPVATERLRPHSGRRLCLVLENWPSLLPAPPPLAWRITPAGLLEWSGAAGATGAETGAETGTESSAPAADVPLADLTIRLDAGNPAAVLARAFLGRLSEPAAAVQVQGDAQLAGDVNWLLQNLRWDVAADVERLFGPALAQPLHQLGRAIAAGMRSAASGAHNLGERLRTWRA